ncbi:MAG: tyrosinase family protein [Actinomycetota bacterium]|nr:tyrosinase family protein [Actinomycetota bacterium]
MAFVRKNQADLSAQEWQALIAAIGALHGIGPSPRYREFVDVHVQAMSPPGMAWSVHSMPGMVGTKFLAWHRRFLAHLDGALRHVDASVTLPYWDWIADPAPPAAISRPALLRSWSVTRRWNAGWLPTAADVNAVIARSDFASFQRVLEQVHNNVHLAVGGTMGGALSPADPLFFLHHANVDRLWAQWQRRHPRAKPGNVADALPPLFGVKVSEVLSTAKLGYHCG